VLVLVTRYSKEFDRGAEPAPLQLALVVFAIQIFDGAVGSPAISPWQLGRAIFSTSVQLRHIFQQALQRHGFADDALYPLSEAFRAGHVHLGGVLKAFEHGHADPSTLSRDRQRAQQRYASLVAFHEDDDVAAFEVKVIALWLEVGCTGNPKRPKAV
jgi:hypothetical protein